MHKFRITAWTFTGMTQNIGIAIKINVKISGKQ